MTRRSFPGHSWGVVFWVEGYQVQWPKGAPEYESSWAVLLVAWCEEHWNRIIWGILKHPEPHSKITEWKYLSLGCGIINFKQVMSLLFIILWVIHYTGVTEAHKKASDRGTRKSRWGDKGKECVTIQSSWIVDLKSAFKENGNRKQP